MQFPCRFGEKCLLNDNVNVVYFFLSDSTTRPSDLPLNVIVQSGNSQAVKSKVVLQMVPPLLGDLGRNENRPRPLPLTTMLNPFFFTKQSSQCILYGFREGSPLHRSGEHTSALHSH